MEWQELIETEEKKEYMIVLRERLAEDYIKGTVFPPEKLVFKALNLPFNDVKVVILGQDPYHNGEAMGLAFSVPRGMRIPPSLRNIFKELKNDLGIDLPKHGDLTKWSDQGVLLLNTTLTVLKHKPMSHSKYGWSFFTDRIIEELSRREKPCVFILWGNHAKSKKKLIYGNHLIIESSHPSPLSAAGFFGSRPFSKTNDFLIKNGISPIDWEL